MTTQELLQLLTGKDIRLWREGSLLRYSAPPEALTPELRQEVAAHKAVLLSLLAPQSDPAVSEGLPDLSLHRRIEAQAADNPQRLAVSAGFLSLTYFHLNARANQLAHRLRRMGVTRDSRVGLLLPRTPDAIIAMLAVLKAGGGYVPLDPASPPERLQQILQDADPLLLLTDKPFPGFARSFSLQREREALSRESTENLTDPGDAESLVYVIYTSGSTGKPKGVEMPRRPLFHLLEWVLCTQNLASGTRTLQFPAFTFDVHFEDIFSALWGGGTLFLASEAERRDPSALWNTLLNNKIERIYLPPVMLQSLAVAFDPALHGGAALERVVCAGEALVITDPVRAMFHALPKGRLFNEYGPSETHVVTALALPPDPDAWDERPSIGVPLPHASVVVLDEQGALVLPGSPGELLIGGEAPARGYLGDLAKTAEKFILRDGKRFYRTGDHVRQNTDGTLAFLGRGDDQVKIRGFRVELGEVESVLRSFPGMEAVVAVSRKTGAEQKLAAYFVSEKPVEERDLREFARQRLPDYMIPAFLIPLDCLPVNQSGKVDRAALPEPEVFRGSVTPSLPFNRWEEAVYESWKEVLGRADFSPDDNFFDLGGHSLLAAQVHSRLQSLFPGQVTVTDCFQYPTMRLLAHFLATGRAQDLDESADNSFSPDQETPIQTRARQQREALQRLKSARQGPLEKEKQHPDES